MVLTPFSHGITRRMKDEDLSIFDYVFCWLGNTNLILSIIKLIEDKMNLEHDVEEAGVQMLLLVEDSIRYYSSILPNLYNYILQQSKNFATEALNRHAATMRMRGRPKVVLARTYNEAIEIYERYKENCLGVISDVRFPLSMKQPSEVALAGATTDEKDAEAGFKLLETIRAEDEYLPLVMESAETSNRECAEKEGFKFVDKNSKMLSVELRHLMEEHMGFGDFIFRNPNTHEEVMRVRNLKELQDNIFTIPNDSMLYHVERNHMSRWLCARAIFPVSSFLKHITWHELQDIDTHRQIIFDAIVKYRHMKNIGVVAEFDRVRFDRYAHFARIGDGSLGGKGRGLAFLDNVVKMHPEFNQYEKVKVQIPKTVVLCTDVFDQFMENNNLYELALSDASDEEILAAFLKAQLPDSYRDDFLTLFEATCSPIAVRSSSLLEDSHYQPFAGIYSTYMIPYLEDREQMLYMMAAAIKAVYASVFYKESKVYMTATRNVIDQEKMAVILQEVVGKTYGDHYYPNVSGVLRSINYYPVNNEKAEEGIASLALGLGKYIVDGGQTLRVSPYHPNHVLQLSRNDFAMRDTQNHFYALDMTQSGTDFKVDDGFNIKKLEIKDAIKDNSLHFIASTYDANDRRIRDTHLGNGPKIISFAGILQYDVIPLPEILRMSMRYGEEAMRRPVEIEFACNINTDRTAEFYLLQIRPIVDSKQMLEENIEEIPTEQCLLRSNNSLGHGISEDVCDVVYVKYAEEYNAGNNPQVALDIETINDKFLIEGKNYVLVGPGRWGSSEPWLGVPVKWANISAAKVIVEVALRNYNVDPSQGTHFFQNLTSFGVGYFMVDTNHPEEGSIIRKDMLDAMPAIEETEYVRHVRFERPLKVMMDGKKQVGVILRS